MKYRYNPNGTDCTACSGVLHPNICEPDLSPECRVFLKLHVTAFVLANNTSDFDKNVPKNVFGIFILRHGACFILRFSVNIMQHYNGAFLQKKWFIRILKVRVNHFFINLSLQGVALHYFLLPQNTQQV